MSFGSELHRWRKAKGLTQQELAVATGVNVSYISNLERGFSANTKSGKPRPSETLCEKFAKVLGIDLDTVRRTAGYAALSLGGIEIDISSGKEKVRVSMEHGNDYSPEERRRFEMAFRTAYETAKRMNEAEKEN